MARSAEVTNFKEATTEDIAKQLDALKQDMLGLTNALTALGKAKGEELGEMAKTTAKSAVATGEAQVERLREQAQNLNESTRDYVAHNPATSLGIAAGLGFAIGLLTARR